MRKMAGNQAHLDALAQRLGYHDYATYAAYQTHQAAMRQANGLNGTPAAQAQQPPQQNWLQNLLSSIPGTPAYLLGKVNDAFGKATGQ
jgi:hypothetical protein